MRRIVTIVALACGSLAGQSADSTQADPITDKFRLEIVRTQRDLLLADAKMKEAAERYIAAKNQAEGLQKALAEKVAEAGKACGAKKAFDAEKLVCVEKAPAAGDK